MVFSSFSSMLHMGGYADYVWPAFAVAIVMLLGNSMLASNRLRKLIRTLRNRYASTS